MKRSVLILLAVALSGLALAQGPTTGPVIERQGPVYPVAGDYERLPAGTVYRAVMDVAEAPEDPSQRNRYLESAARYLNMHARDGVDPGDLTLAVVVHGGAAMSLLDDAAYRERFGAGNPNREMLAALGEAGVPIYLCGQTATHYGIEPDHLLPQVTMALSAMTMLVKLQSDGYALLP